MFGIIMRNPKYCKTFLETVLGVKINRIEYPQAQKTIDISLSSKSVRLNIFIEDDRNTIYNVEILPLGDETTKIILNTKGTAIDVSDDMKALLNYIDGQLPSDAYTTELR